MARYLLPNDLHVAAKGSGKPIFLKGSRQCSIEVCAACVLDGSSDRRYHHRSDVHHTVFGPPSDVGGRRHKGQAGTPTPNESSICNSATYEESLIQPYLSPTILQANETGTLVMAYDYQNDWCVLVSTRQIPAFGFEPMMGKRMFHREQKPLKIFMGLQDVIQEGDMEGDEICFDNDLENASIGYVCFVYWLVD